MGEDGNSVQTPADMPDLSRWPAWIKLSNSQLLRILLILACAWALLQVLNYFELVITIMVILS